MRGEYIYVIESIGAPVKIGVSCNPFERIKDLQTGVPDQLYLAHHEKAGDKPFLLESMVHKYLSKHCVRGEIFAVSVETAKRAIAEQLDRLSRGFTDIPDPPNKYKLLRESIGVSVEYLAERSRMLVSDIHKFERGELKKVSDFQRIERALFRIRDRRARYTIQESSNANP